MSTAAQIPKRKPANELRHRLVINTTFCGEWAGQDAIWRQHGECAQAAPSCKDYVTNNPGKFNEAFWSIKSISEFALYTFTWNALTFLRGFCSNLIVPSHLEIFLWR